MEKGIPTDKYCTVHPQNRQVAICLKSNCPIFPRLLCLQCMTENHPHATDSILFEQINSANKPIFHNFPKIKEVTEIISFVEKKTFFDESMIDQLFSKLQDQIVATLTILRREFKIKLQKEEDQRRLVQQNLLALIKKVTNIDFIKKQVNLFYDKVINEAQFNDVINKFILETENLQQLQQIYSIFVSEVQKVQLFLDKTTWDFQVKTLNQSISDLTKSLRRSSYISNFVPRLNEENSFKQIDNVNRYNIKMCNPNQNIQIYTKEVLVPWDKYEIRLRMNYMNKNFYVGLIEDQKREQDYPADSPRVLLYGDIEEYRVMKKSSGADITQLVKKQQSIEIVIYVSIMENIFKIEQEKNSLIELDPSFLLRNKNWRLYFFDNSRKGQDFDIVLF